MPTFSIKNQKCPKECLGTVVIHSKKCQRFRCTVCGKTWGFRTGSFHYRLRLPASRVDFALQKLREGASIRRVAELCKTSPGTIQRWKIRHLYFQRKFNP